MGPSTSESDSPRQTDVAPHGFSSHQGGYYTTATGLNIATHPWNRNMMDLRGRQDRANFEANYGG